MQASIHCHLLGRAAECQQPSERKIQQLPLPLLICAALPAAVARCCCCLQPMLHEACAQHSTNRLPSAGTISSSRQLVLPAAAVLQQAVRLCLIL